MKQTKYQLNKERNSPWNTFCIGVQYFIYFVDCVPQTQILAATPSVLMEEPVSREGVCVWLASVDKLVKVQVYNCPGILLICILFTFS